jgi:hypothetical protein
MVFSILEFAPFGPAKAVTVVSHIETPDTPDQIALLSTTPFDHRKFGVLCRTSLHYVTALLPGRTQIWERIKVTHLPCLRDSQSSLQYLRSLVTDYCKRKWSQRNWTHPMPRVPHLTNARHHLLPSHLRGNSSITPSVMISSVRYSVTIGTAGATSA